MAENFREQWAALSGAAKVGIALGFAAVIVLVVVLSIWAMRDEYQVLFSDLDPQDGGVIVSELERLKVPYRLADDGRTVLIDKDAVYKTRLKLMSKGVNLKGTVGFEIFNTSDFGMTEFAQKINYQRALQGELARTIMSFEEVKMARVHLVLPESGLFKKAKGNPKASISLVMRDEAPLRQEQILGIQRLVAAAIPELDPAAVTILDQKGVALTRNFPAESDSEAVSSRFEAKRQVETYITKKVVEILDRAFGPGQAIVSVDVTLNQDHVKVTREDVLSASTKDGETVGVVTKKRQTRQGDAQLKEIDTQMQTESLRRDASRRGTMSTVETEYQNGRKTEQTVTTPGSIKRMSVGVLLPSYVDQYKIKKMTEVIAMAVGLNIPRGDAIAVYSVDSPMPAKKSGGEAVNTERALIEKTAITKPMDVDANKRSLGLYWTLVALIAATGAALVVAVWRRHRRDRGGLNSAERERVLAQINRWLKTGHTRDIPTNPQVES